MQQSALINESVSVAEGRIYHHAYPYYILTGRKIWCLASDRTVYVYSPAKMNCCLCFKDDRKKYSDRDPSAIWLFEPVAGRANTFYLRNKKYDNEYLRGSYESQELVFHKHWSVCVSERDRFSGDDEFLFMWRFDRVDADRYRIWNVRLESPLYTRRMGKSVVLALKDKCTDINSERFEWVFKCLGDIDPVTMSSN